MAKSFFAGIATSLLIAVNAYADRVTLVKVPLGEEWGLLISGTTASGPVNHRVAVGTGTELELENFRTGPNAEDELIAVTRERALKLVEGVPWSDEEGDLVEVEFGPAIEIPLTLWIVKGPFDEAYDHVAEHLLTLVSLWQQERVGVRLKVDVEVVDATGNSKAGFFHDFDCSDRQDLEQAIGSRVRRINVYRVDTVNGSSFSAEACAFGSGFAALGRSTGSDLLVHEIGHGFGFEHPDGLDGFDGDNVMAAASSTREFLTEGQTFRAHVDPHSVINSLLGARAGEPVRSCPHAAASASCLPLATRIWPDAPVVP
jgi:hypothetical protein